MNKKIVQNVMIGGVSAVFAFSIVAFTSQGSVSAALTIGGNEAECNTNLKKGTLEQVKAKRDSSLGKRKAALADIKKELIAKRNNNNAKAKAVTTKIDGVARPYFEKKRQDAFDKLNGLTDQQLGTNPQLGINATPALQNDTSKLDADIKNAETLLNSSNLRSGQKNTVVSAVCTAIFTSKVYSYILPTARQQYLQSRVNLMTANHWYSRSRANIAQDLYATGKTAYGNTFDSVFPDLKQSVDNASTKSNSLSGGIANAVGKVNSPKLFDKDQAKTYYRATSDSITPLSKDILAQTKKGSDIYTAYSKSIEAVTSCKADLGCLQ